MTFSSVSYDDEAESRVRSSVRDVLNYLQRICWSYGDEHEQRDDYRNFHSEIQKGIFSVLNEYDYSKRRKFLCELQPIISDLAKKVDPESLRITSTDNMAEDVKALDQELQSFSEYEDLLSSQVEERDFDGILEQLDTIAEGTEPALRILHRLISFTKLKELCSTITSQLANLPPFLDHDKRHVALLEKANAELREKLEKANKTAMESRTQMNQERRRAEDLSTKLRALEGKCEKLEIENRNLKDENQQLSDKCRQKEDVENAEAIIRKGQAIQTHYRKISEIMREIKTLCSDGQ